MPALKYKRILLKLSGEALMGSKPFGIDPNMLSHYAHQIKKLREKNVEIAIVIGGGNIFRGMQAEENGIERVQGDYMGMMATVMNGMFAAGIGSPYFTTDSAAALRANEINADVILKGTRVDGIYTADPEIDKTATRYDNISFSKVIADGLKVMDMTAFTICQENNLPIIVFDVNKPGNMTKIVTGEPIGTLVMG